MGQQKTTEYKHIDVRGARLAYHDAGRGQPIILVHANLSDVRTWDTIFPLLAERHHVVAYSRRYAWPNEPIRAMDPDPWEEQAEDLATLIKKLELQPCHIVGNSTGATLALLVAKKYPGLVRTLFLEEPPVVTLFIPKIPPTLLDVLRLLWSHPWSFLPVMSFGIFTIAASESAFRNGKDDIAVKTFLSGVLEKEAFQNLSTGRLEQAIHNSAPHKALLCHGSLPAFTESNARAITTAAYLFTASRTSSAQKHINAYLSTLMPNGIEIHFSGISHFQHEDDPHLIAEAISSYITEGT